MTTDRTTRNRRPPTATLPAGAVVAERIAAAYPGLTPALRAFADFVLAEPMLVARLSINETVAASSLSVATANRFARTIGFDGYAQFRAELIRGFEPVFAPVERLRRKLSEGGSARDAMVASLEEDIANLEATIHNLDADRCTQAAEMLAGARQIFILAFDNAAALGTVFAHRLETTGCSVRLVENGGGTMTAARHLSRLGPEDLAVAIAFPRYMNDTVALTRRASQWGLRILAITDHQSSPIASLGKLTLYVRASRTFSSTSDAAILALLEALAAGVSSRRPNAADGAQRFADFVFPWLSVPGEDS